MKGDNSRSTESTMTEMLCKLLRQQAAPEVDVEVFDGNPLNFQYFISVFKEVVETKVDDPRGRLTRLIKYTSGEAKDLVRNCINLPTSICYQNVNGEVVDYEMRAHVFGGTSSPSCSNYALKRTALDNEVKYGKESATTLKKRLLCG